MSSRPPHELGRERRRSPSSRVGQGHERGRSATRHESPSRPCGLVSPRQDRHDRRPPPCELCRESRRLETPRSRSNSPGDRHADRTRDYRDSPSRPGGLMSPRLHQDRHDSRPPPELGRCAFDLRPRVKRKFDNVTTGRNVRQRG